ncbi:MAG: hypothetical protein H5T85_04650 [Actinobacteria bacterium]|nr:hypothetical protein [Actinomycetota bacterium]
MDDLQKLPRYWPIVFVLGKLGKLYNNFNLQKFIYLAKVEGKIPIDYVFTKHNYGPYCPQIKVDARTLNKKDIISMCDNGIGWIFKITDNGLKEFERIENLLPEKYKERFESILDGFKHYSRYRLQNYIYAKHIRSLGKNEEIKNSLIKDVNNLIDQITEFPPSHNSVFIQGALDYCLLILKKEEFKDPVKKDELLQVTSDFILNCSMILDLVGKDKNILDDMDLSDLEQDFEYVQSVAKAYNILPHIDDEVPLEMYGI